MNTDHIVNYNGVTLAQDSKVVFENLNFTLRRAEQCYIIGESGSGKSTFIRSMYADVKIQSGLAYVFNYDLGRIKRNQIPLLRRSLGIVFQNFYLFDHWTASENLAYVLKATDWKDKAKMRSRVKEVLELVGISKYSDVAVHKLSGGEKQRLAIARSFINAPQLIIADEPTGNLDPDTSDEIIELLLKIASDTNAAIIFATHDYRIIEKYPARVFKCNNKLLSETSLT